ncbi:MAG: trypsin-like peptidase domain-containing protein [Planctomycetota bacterium]
MLSFLGILGLLAVPEWKALRTREERQAAQIVLISRNLEELNQGRAEGARSLADHSSQLESQEARVAALDRALRSEAAERSSLAGGVEGLRRELETRFEAARPVPSSARSARHRHELKHDLLDPVFQLAGRDAVGSGVLIHHGEDERGGFYLALTCYHVIRDILEERDGVQDPYQEKFDALIDRGEGSLSLKAEMIRRDLDLDLALVRIDTPLSLEPLARIAPLARMKEVEVFSPVYTVGCPLGTAAQATHGEVTRTDWTVSGQNFWMVSSPAYFGNSGGGVFLDESRELIGIFAKIYTHGTFRPQVVTHMGLAIPLDVITGWWGGGGFGERLPGGREALAKEAAAGD